MSNRTSWDTHEAIPLVGMALVWCVSSMAMIWLVHFWSPLIHPAVGIGTIILGIPFGVVAFFKLVQHADRIRARELDRDLRAESARRRATFETERAAWRSFPRPSPEKERETERLDRLARIELQMYALLGDIPSAFRARKYIARHQKLLQMLAEYERLIPNHPDQMTRENMMGVALRIYQAIGLWNPEDGASPN